MSDAEMPADPDQVFDAIVVGTGFAGAVTACRLVEANCRICVLERGRRYGPEDFPRYPIDELFVRGNQDEEHFAPLPDFSRWLWNRDNGLYDLRDLGDALAVQAAGFGGGSLIYANVHLRPPREIFEQGWPQEYQPIDGVSPLDPYFDLAAWMLNVSLVPTRLAKTLQLERAARDGIGSPAGHWFRTPLAVSFDGAGQNRFGREQQPCDMRGRCWLGCDREAKQTLDKNYLACAEDGGADVRTLAEVTSIRRDQDGIFTVEYRDLLRRGAAGEGGGEQRGYRSSVKARFVFLCAGAVNTTELLLRNPRLWEGGRGGAAAGDTPIGSHYFPNADSLAVVFDCDEPHEADYGPTITSALLFQRPAEGRSLDFHQGRVADGSAAPVAGTMVTSQSGATARLQHDPIPDWGDWHRGEGAAGALMLTDVEGAFAEGDTLSFGGGATARARAAVTSQTHWFLAEDGGYPPDLAPLIGLFRSPIWLRRNRYRETSFPTDEPVQPPRRAMPEPLRVRTFAAVLDATARHDTARRGFVARTAQQNRLRATDLLEEPLRRVFPGWFLDALERDRQELVSRTAAIALPMLGRVLDTLSARVAEQIDADVLSRLGLGREVAGVRQEVLIRGVLRQGLQVIAGSESAIADAATEILLQPLPTSPERLLETLGGLLLWALAYREAEGHTGMILTMGRDLFRGRLELQGGFPGRLRARLPGQLLDTSSVMQERVLRAIARNAWKGELRTNPAWMPLGKQITVHSQGGCPMGSAPEHSVTDAWGEVHACPGLYVMDAAAFPTSVGVNPSATIAAVAEYKIEHFIRKNYDPAWTADTRTAAAWVDAQGRQDLDPLNHRQTKVNDEPPDVGVLGLTFKESMDGYFTDGKGDRPAFPWDDLLQASACRLACERAEGAGMRARRTIAAHLIVSAPDLAQVVSREREGNPVTIPVGGTVTLKDGASAGESLAVDGARSVLRFFVRPGVDTDPPTRFFHYRLYLRGAHDADWSVLNGIKVLRDGPGFDLWSDTATLFFEIAGPRGRRLGILRLSALDFLEKQLPSMNVTGTNDPARQSWALASFYAYFLRNLIAVYVRQTDTLFELFGKALASLDV